MSALDLLFPKCCVICGSLDANWMCEKCYSKISKYKNDKIVTNPISQNNVYDYFYLYKYKNIVRELLIKYKFFESPYVANFFANELIKNKKVIGKIFFYDIIVPIPMSKNKLKLRGYNQSELVAKYLVKLVNKIGVEHENCKQSKIKYLNVFKKKEGIKQQAKLTKQERLENVKNAFYIDEIFIKYLKGKNVVLLDDIYTTGATINECYKILKQYGAKDIFVITLTRDFG